ncbi:hypothetical protein LP316_06050 [Thalassotalea sp. LPB0316]|uniref:hypothetical protein n=1 Tax=Thalassotalea sp. LPB0316 TaxID=2769490 RepID=UPI0018661751|nr:hypothetical protein [Thalassotalea sp. LPB0316]QOL26853.1 hypothetical protein LP316_06050 [Thalassotalea sp. LPB0316]
MRNLVAVSLFGAFALTGCQSTKATFDINEDVDFSQITSCQLSEQPAQELENPVLLSMTHQAISEQVIAQGIALITQESPCQISYNLTYQDKPNNSSVNFSFGTGRTTGNSSIGIGVGKTIDLPSAETIITTIHVNVSYDQVPAWYGASAFDNELDLPTSTRQKRIDETLERIFSNFPSTQAKE